MLYKGNRLQVVLACLLSQEGDPEEVPCCFRGLVTQWRALKPAGGSKACGPARMLFVMLPGQIKGSDTVKLDVGEVCKCSNRVSGTPNPHLPCVPISLLKK